MTDPIARHAASRPEAEALWTENGAWTYGEFDAAVGRTARHLQQNDKVRGTRVAIRHEPGPEAIILFWALWRVGAVAVPISLRVPPAQVGRRAAAVGAQILVTDEPTVASQGPDSVTVWSPRQIVARRPSEVNDASSSLSADRPATIVFTSGSTGTPKAALHTWSNHLYSAKGSNANIPLGEGDRWLLTLPLYHVGGLAILVRCAIAGAAVAVAPRGSGIAGGMRRTDATHVSLVSTQLRRVLDETEASPPGRLRAVLLGGGPLPAPLVRRAYRRQWPVHTSYGCTEMGSQITTTPPGATLDELRTAGRRLPHRRIRIDDGEIHVSGPTLFEGYVSATGLEDPRTDDGWYATGDRGRLDPSGNLHVLGRKDRMFVSGGENVQPEEIEAALEELAGVKRAVVVPVPDDEYGQRPVAFVERDEQEGKGPIEQRLADDLSGFKVPDAFFSFPEAGATDELKIDLQGLQRRACKLHDDS